MTIITDKKLVINDKFEKAISIAKGDPIGEDTIEYKDWKKTGKKSPIYRIGIEYCRFRSENGRIKTETLTHATREKALNDLSAEDQEKIAGFLEKSDPAKNEELMKSLKSTGQTEPAIITADGFLINGNRRRWALGKLFETHKKDRESFKYINVIILPGHDENGHELSDAPTHIDIALLENRLQMRRDGWSEYSVMNKVLSFRSYTDGTVELDELLDDDPNFSELSEKDFKKAVKDWKTDNFGTLDLIDLYLESNGMKGDYKKIEHRWESFKELNQKIISKFDNKSFKTFLHNFGYSSDDKGAITQACFNLIKLKDPKVANYKRHTDIIREIKGWMEFKDDFLKLADIEDVGDGHKTAEDKDRVWQHKRAGEVSNLIKALTRLDKKQDLQDGPIDRLREALKKFDHKHLDEDQIKRLINDNDIEEAMELCQKIQTVSRDLHATLFAAKKKHPKNLKKGTRSLADFKEANKDIN
jgi:hypothetical protein